MGYVINLGILFILVFYAVRLLSSKPSYIHFENEEILLNGPEKFLLFTIVTGMFMCGPFSAIRLLIWELLVIFSLYLYGKIIKPNVIIFAYLVFLLWLILEFVRTPSYFYGLRVFVKYLYPFVIMLFAATFIRNEKFIYIAMKYLVYTGLMFSILMGGVFTNIIYLWVFYSFSVFWPMSTLGDFIAIVSAASFLLWWKTREKKYLFFILWFLLSEILQSVRTSLLAITIVLIIGSFLKYKLKSLPYIIGSIFFIIGVILYVPYVKNKMFFNPQNIYTIEDIIKAQESGQINTSMREYMWNDLMHRFYENNELFGKGLGTVQHFMYTNFVYGGLHVPHSDYVQMLCDTGLIGLILYLLLPFLLIFYLRKYLFKPPIKGIILSAQMSFLSFIAVLISMGFDNVVNYNVAAHSYPFIFLGIHMAYRTRRIYD